METKNYNNENLEALRSLPPIPRNLELDECLSLQDELCVMTGNQMREYYALQYSGQKIHLLSSSTIGDLLVVELFGDMFVCRQSYMPPPPLIAPVTLPVIEEVCKRFSVTPEQLTLKSIPYHAHILQEDHYNLPIQSLKELLTIMDKRKNTASFIRRLKNEKRNSQ
jgi:hypothetical protein